TATWRVGGGQTKRRTCRHATSSDSLAANRRRARISWKTAPTVPVPLPPLAPAMALLPPSAMKPLAATATPSSSAAPHSPPPPPLPSPAPPPPVAAEDTLIPWLFRYCRITFPTACTRYRIAI
ncbi:unnamed protein product, partial [Closterium sp. NIES-53]